MAIATSSVPLAVLEAIRRVVADLPRAAVTTLAAAVAAARRAVGPTSAFCGVRKPA